MFLVDKFAFDVYQTA